MNMKLLRSAALCAIAMALAGVAGTARAGLFNVPTEPADWNGIYMGFNAGVVWDHYDVGPYRTALNLDQQFFQIIAMEAVDNKPALDPPIRKGLFGSTSFSADGHSDTDVAPIGGLHVGYKKQFGHFVAGLEFGFEGTQTSKGSESRSFQTNFPVVLGDEPIGLEAETHFDSSRRAERNWDGWLGGQLGYAWGRFLFYGTGGYTFADVAVYSFDRARTGFFESGFDGNGDQPIGSFIGQVSTRQYSNTSDIMNGWFAGGGTQYALNDKVAIGLEYRHSDFGDETFRFKPTHPIFPGATNVNLSSDQVEFTVNIMLGHLGH